MSVWEKHTFGGYEPCEYFKNEAEYNLYCLKEWEAYTRTSVEASRTASFHSRAIDL